MYSSKRTNQGGSVAVFLIVSVLLAAAVIGGVYAVNQRGNQARITQPVAQQSAPSATQNQPTKQQQDTEAAKKQEAARKQAEAAEQAEEAKKAAEAKQKQAQAEAQAAKEQAQKAEQQRVAQNNAQQPTTVPQTGTGHLPTTGPADTLIGLIAGGVMIGIIGAYLRSYRHRFGSLLR